MTPALAKVLETTAWSIEQAGTPRARSLRPCALLLTEVVLLWWPGSYIEPVLDHPRRKLNGRGRSGGQTAGGLQKPLLGPGTPPLQCQH